MRWLDLVDSCWPDPREVRRRAKREKTISGIAAMLKAGPRTSASLREIHGYQAEALAWVLVGRKQALYCDGWFRWK